MNSKRYLFAALIFFAVLFNASNLRASFLDATFQPGSGAEGGFIESMAIQPDGKIIVCGNFTSFNGQPYHNIARLNSDGSLDTTFSADVSYWVRSVALQADGKIVVGGFFQNVGEESRNRVARLNADGSLDTTFNVGTGCDGRVVEADPTDPFIFAVAVQQDGKILIGGNFTSYNGVSRSGLARLNSNGSLDTAFDIGSGANSWVRSIVVQTNGQILVSGWFTDFHNQSHNRMVLLNSDGSPDTSFSPYFGDSTAIYTMAQVTGGKYVVAGHSVNPDAPFRQEIVRLNPDGSYDTAFNTGGSGADEKVESVAIQPDGKIVLGGYFSTYNDAPVDGLIRLFPDGTLDSSFSASVDNWIWTVLLQPDGKVLICGAFSTVDDVPRSCIARLNGQFMPHLSSPNRTGNTFKVSVQTQSGKSYVLQYKNLITDSAWNSLSTVSGDGTTKILSDANASVSQRFYRILEN